MSSPQRPYTNRCTCCGSIATVPGPQPASRAEGDHAPQGDSLRRISRETAPSRPDLPVIGALNHLDEERLLLLRGGCILSMDPRIGDLPSGDVLVQGRTIRAVAPSIQAPDAVVIDATGCIVLPGFVDSHRHVWTTVFRRWVVNAKLVEYRIATNHLSSIFRPEDVYIGELLSCLSAMETGTTTMLDWSHIPITPEHNDAAIEGLRASGMRTVYGYGPSRINHPSSRYPQDIARIRNTWFSGAEGLQTLQFAADVDSFQLWQIARDLDLRITAHLLPRSEKAFQDAFTRGLVRNDAYFIHCTNLSAGTWERIRDAGCSVSIAPSGVTLLGISGGIPPIQAAVDHGILPSLSGDTEVSEPGDMFTEMRTALAMQRALAQEAHTAGREPPSLLTDRDAVAMTTLQGARALGLERRIGSLTPGKQADLQLIRWDPRPMARPDEAYAHVVWSADRGSVELVMVAGRIVKWGQALVGVDEGAVRRHAEAARDWVLARSGYSMDPLGEGFNFRTAGEPPPEALALIPSAVRVPAAHR